MTTVDLILASGFGICIGIFLVQFILLEKKKPKEQPADKVIPDNIQRVVSQLQVAMDTRHRQTIAAIDALTIAVDKMSESQINFLRSMFGDSVLPPDPRMASETEDVRKLAERFMRRFDCTRDEAIKRAKAALVYSPGGDGMGATE